MSNAHTEQWKKSQKIKIFKTHCETPYDKSEEHILNIIVQGSDNKILLIKIVFNEGKRKIGGDKKWSDWDVVNKMKTHQT